MKTFLRATAAAALLMLPGISLASNLDYVQSGSNYQVLFDPNGSGTNNLPKSFFYRSYDCRIGSKPVVINNIHIVTPPSNNGGTTPPAPPTSDITPPDTGGTTPSGVTPPPGNNNPPPHNPGGCDGNMAAVPVPASAEMAGAGLVMIALASWRRSRNVARA
ncbi:MAG TPA: hypothetical protein VGG44_10395 [Tepidisphaeraceae bacterium]|jgi:hypothetical protein